MQSFPGYKKISKTKLDRAGLWGYSKLRQESILFSFLFYCWIFQRREDKKYPQIFEERWRKCIFVSVERESEARLNFLLFFVLLPWFFIIIIFFFAAFVITDVFMGRFSEWACYDYLCQKNDDITSKRMKINSNKMYKYEEFIIT